ncbi:MAG: DUF998 domain-containing protein [Candidatus Thorarchaeota archaeon]
MRQTSLVIYLVPILITMLKFNNYDKSVIAGTLLYIGMVQWVFGLLIAEAWFPGYSSRIDYVSDLGIGPTALVYNVSVFLLGFFVVISAYFIYQVYTSRIITILVALTGVGAMGVGVFPASIQPMHSFATLTALLFGALAAIATYRIQKPPLSYISVILGVISLVTAVLFIPYLGLPTGSTETFLGMAKGSMERWVIYPILVWAIGMGSHLIGSGKESGV